MKKVGIILINYKGYAEKFIIECWSGLMQQTYPKELTRIYIVDNAATEQTLKYLDSNCPSATVIPRPDGNYAAGNNAGIGQARKDGCEYFVIVNMDVAFDNDWLSELVKALEFDTEIGIAQSKVLLYEKDKLGNNLINSLGNSFHYLGFGFTDGYQQIVESTEQKVTEIKGYASGCSLIIKKAVLDKIGTYDEEYYMYHDDLELSWRAKLAGYKIVLANKSIIYHKYEFKRSVLMLYYLERNRFLAIFTYYRIRTLLLILPALLFLEVGMWLYAGMRGWLKTKIRVAGYFLRPKSWNHIIQRRNAVNAYRKKTDKEMLADFKARVEFQEIDNPLLKYIGNPILNSYFNLIKKLIKW
ncbi:MAG: hypothetical protein UT91_C0011G0021 [Parcubacteria group bacterium GW2011_GWA2_40_23]|nr:MAG: hypothetical protein UT91_C0011G0021 [Parcubacteria group bacterium GW2011_GWA2_40_23]